VLRGADKNINMYIKSWRGLTVANFQWTNEGNMDTVVNETGLIYSKIGSHAFFIVN